MATRTRPRSSKKPAPPRTSPDVRVEEGVVRRAGIADEHSSNGRADGRVEQKAARRTAKRVFTRKGADRHELYQLSVQSPEEDCDFFARVYRTLRKKEARHFREDFCGTALNCSQWLRRHDDNTAEGFDIDPDPVGWGIDRNFAPLGEEARRCTLHLKDVREPSAKRPDVRTATNFSYWCFHERPTLLEYFRAAHRDLKKDGVFVLDTYGGPDSMQEMVEERKIAEGFTYVWDQVSYHPATGEYKAYIHFRFKDGTELKRAFRYDWRLWSLTEVVDLLREAGFSAVDSYWEGTAEDGESGNGIYRRSRRGENCEAWVTYIVAQR
jgi:SAM-dependent methyltransferase